MRRSSVRTSRSCTRCWERSTWCSCSPTPTCWRRASWSSSTTCSPLAWCVHVHTTSPVTLCTHSLPCRTCSSRFCRRTPLPLPPPLRRALLIVVPAPQLLAAWCVYVVPVFSIPSPVQVPALYEPDEKDALANSQRAAVKAAGQFDTKENCWTFFVNRCRNHLHLVLAMSPSGETLRRRCRNFPVRSVAGRPAAVHRHCPSAGLRGEGVVCRVCVGGGLR
jgi:hypothetical protein